MGKLVKDLIKMSKTSFVKEHKGLAKSLRKGLKGEKAPLKQELKKQTHELKKVGSNGKYKKN